QCLPARSQRPCGQERIVIVHRDDERGWTSGGAEFSKDLGQIRGDRGETVGDAGLVDTGQTDTLIDVVCTDVQCDKGYAMGLQKAHGCSQLVASRIVADTAL